MGYKDLCIEFPIVLWSVIITAASKILQSTVDYLSIEFNKFDFLVLKVLVRGETDNPTVHSK